METFVGKFINANNRLIKIEAVFYSKIQPFYLLRWMDTDEVFCEYPDKIIELLGVNEWKILLECV